MASPEEPNPWESSEDLDEPLALPAFLFDPLGVLRRRWKWAVAAILVGLVATGAAVYRVKPTFVATASVLITRQQIPEDFVRSTVREDAISNINAMVGKVLAKENLARLIEQFQLFSEAPPEITDDMKIGKLRSGISVDPISGWGTRRGYQGSMIYEVSYRAKNPEATSDIANALASLFMEASIERRGELARLTTDFLSRQLERDEAELREQSQSVSEFRREHRGELPDELDTNLRRLGMLNERRESLQGQISGKENRIITLQTLPQAAAPTQNEILLDELRRELARESAAHTDEHPNVVALRERVSRLTAIVEEDRASLDSSLVVDAERRDLALLKTQLYKLQGEIEDLTARIDATPGNGEELGALQQKEMVLRERYLDSLRKVEEAQLAENLEAAQQGAQVSILDRASTPTSPERPRWMLAAAGVIAALGLGVAVMILFELIDPVIVSTRQLERLADGACIGSLPQSV